MSHLPGDDHAPPPPPPGSQPKEPPPPPPSEGGTDASPTGPFRVVDGLALVGWSVLAQFLVLIPFVLAGLEIDETVSVADLAVLLVAQLVTVGGVIAYLAIRGRLSWDVFGAPNWSRDLLLGLGVGAVGFGIVTLTSIVLNMLFGPLSPPEQALLETSTAGGMSTVLSAVITVVMAPIIEETVFRGVLFRSILDRAGFWTAAIVSGLVFVGVHPEILLSQPLLGISLFALAVWLAGAYHRSGSLLVPVVGHAVFNGVSLSFAMLGA